MLISLSLVFCGFSESEDSGVSELNNRFGETIKSALEDAKPAMNEAIICGGKLLAVGALCGAALSVCDSVKAPQQKTPIRIIGVGIMSSIAFFDINGFLQSVKELCGEITVLLSTLLPTMTAAQVIMGGTAQAAASQAVYIAVVSIINIVFTGILIPAISIYFAFSMTAAAFGNKLLEGISESIKSYTTFFLKLITALIVGYTLIYKSFGAATDSIAKRGIKTAISSSVPIIGSIIAETAGSIIDASSTAKSIIGIGGIISLLSIVLITVLRLGIYLLVFKAFSLLITSFGDDSLSDAAESICGGFSLLFAVAVASISLALMTVFTSISTVAVT